MQHIDRAQSILRKYEKVIDWGLHDRRMRYQESTERKIMQEKGDIALLALACLQEALEELDDKPNSVTHVRAKEALGSYTWKYEEFAKACTAVTASEAFLELLPPKTPALGLLRFSEPKYEKLFPE